MRHNVKALDSRPPILLLEETYEVTTISAIISHENHVAKITPRILKLAKDLQVDKEYHERELDRHKN